MSSGEPAKRGPGQPGLAIRKEGLRTASVLSSLKVTFGDSSAISVSSALISADFCAVVQRGNQLNRFGQFLKVGLELGFSC